MNTHNIPVEYEVRRTCLSYSIHMDLLKCFLMTCLFSDRENMLNENGHDICKVRNCGAFLYTIYTQREYEVYIFPGY